VSRLAPLRLLGELPLGELRGELRVDPDLAVARLGLRELDDLAVRVLPAHPDHTLLEIHVAPAQAEDFALSHARRGTDPHHDARASRQGAEEPRKLLGRT
jgi:hypothetical protein